MPNYVTDRCNDKYKLLHNVKTMSLRDVMTIINYSIMPKLNHDFRTFFLSAELRHNIDETTGTNKYTAACIKFVKKKL